MRKLQFLGDNAGRFNSEIAYADFIKPDQRAAAIYNVRLQTDVGEAVFRSRSMPAARHRCPCDDSV